jgi:hypothetical protein
MRTLFAVISIGAVSLNAYYHYQYARANYPKSRSWYTKICLSAFVAGACGFLSLLQELGTVEYLFAIGGGILLATASLFLFPHSAQYIIPKR